MEEEKTFLQFKLFGSENEVWRQSISTLGLIQLQFSVQIHLCSGYVVPDDDTIFNGIWCHLPTLEIFVVEAKSAWKHQAKSDNVQRLRCELEGEGLLQGFWYLVKGGQ